MRRCTRRGLFDRHRYTVEISRAWAANGTSVRLSSHGTVPGGGRPVTPLALGWLMFAGQFARMRP